MGNTAPNVIQECEEDDFNMEYIRGGIITSIPNEVKPRPKIGRNPKAANKSNSKIKNESLRSALSVDLDNPEAERIRKEFDMFRLSKENELANHKRKEKKLETENRKLKTELQALQKTCKKLRDERDCALDAEQRALMRASAIETDRDKVQRQFKIFRETKESELQNLLKVKRILESKIMKIDPSLLEVNFQKDDEPSDIWTTVDSIVGFYPPHPPPNDHEVIGHNRHYDVAVRQLDRGDQLRNCSDIVTVCWFPCQGDPDMTEVTLFQDKLEKCCKTGNHLLNFVRIQLPEEGSPEAEQGEAMTLATRVLTMATNSHFLGAIFSDFSAANPQNVKLLEAVLLLQIPLQIFICSADGGGDDDADDDDDDDGNPTTSNLVDELKLKEWNTSISLSLHRSFEDLSRRMHEAVTKKLRSKHLEQELDCLNLMGWDDSTWEWQDWQEHLFHEHLARFNPLPRRHGDGRPNSCPHKDRSFEFSWLDKYMAKISVHVLSPGPVPPLLVDGGKCSGRTTLLMRWIDQYRQRYPPSLVLSYSVIDGQHPSGDPFVLLRCLMFQIMQHFMTPFGLSPDPNQLVRDFPKWLEKVSTLFPGGVVLVLDSIDEVQNFEVIFDWLTDPLPVDLRVIISLRSIACPPSWRSWPLLSIDPMTEIEVREYVDLLACDSSKLDKEVVLTHLLDDPSLCLPLTARLVSEVSTSSPDAMEVLSTCHTPSDLYAVILTATEEQLNKESIRELLGLLCCPHQGLTLSELVEVTGRSEFKELRVLVEQLEFMIEVGLLGNSCGLITLKNEEARHAIQNLLTSSGKEGDDDDDDDGPIHVALKNLSKYYLSKLRNRRLTPRGVSELAWISWKLRDLEKIRAIVSDLELCLTFLWRGLGSQLLAYWRALRCDLVTVSSKLDQKLQEFEQILDNSKESQSLLSASYEMVGKFLVEQGLHEEALEILQRCEEFQGHDLLLGPLKAGRVSNLLGHIHDKLGRRVVAETMYLTALSHFEGVMEATGRHDDGDDDNDDVGKESLLDGCDPKKSNSAYGDGSDSHHPTDDDDDGENDDDDDDDVKLEYRYHHLVAAQLDLLAGLHLKQGRTEMSDNFLKRASNLRSKMNNKNIGNCANVGQMPCKESIKQKIEALTSSLGSCALDDLSLAGVEQELGVLHALLGRYGEAEAFLNGSLIKRESLLPGNHPSVVQSLNSLVALYGQSKQANKVEELSEKLIQSVQKMAGQDQSLALQTMRNLVHTSRRLGRMDKAELYLELLLDLLKENSSTPPYDFATTLVNLAVVCSQQGKHLKAEPLYKRALNTFRTVLPANHPRIMETVKNLAISKYEQGDFEEAARFYLLTVKPNQFAPQ